MWKYVAGAAAIAAIAFSLVLAYRRADSSAAASALLALEEAPAGDSRALESAYAKALAQVVLVRSASVRERLSTLVHSTYVKKRESIAEAKDVTLRALALMNADFESLSSLRAARDRAVKLAGTLPSAADVASLLSQIGQIYDAQRKVIETRMAAELAAEQAKWGGAEEEADEQQERAAETAASLEAERESALGVPGTERSNPYCCCSRRHTTWGGDKWIHQWLLVDDCLRSYRIGLETYHPGDCVARSECGG